MTIWSQSLRGKALDLVEPTSRQVDFREIADTLANINRYTGAAEKPVSVALHTLIAAECAAPPEIRPWVLLHDAHEARVGVIGDDQLRAFCKIAEEMFGITASDIVRQTVAEAKHRHDVVIHAAAGLAMPNAGQRIAIHHADITALATERRDFLARCSRPWRAEIEAVRPARKVYRFMPPDVAAERLYREFCIYFPSLRPGATP